MGTVYLARHPDLPRSEALKVLSKELSGDPDFRARFVREADVAAALDHPNIVSVHQRGEFDGQLWIAMQFVDGTDADAAVRAGTMTPGRAVHVTGEVGKALDYAHQRGVLHRDVKPGNFMLSGQPGPEERVLLGDFGIARALGDVGLTATGSVMATIAYAAPEVLAGGTVDSRSDIYSLGCSLFQMLTGRAPFTSPNGIAAVMAAHLHAPPPTVSDRVPGMSQRMDAVIATAMAKDPAQRFATARELAAAAAHALGAVGAPGAPLAETAEFPGNSVATAPAASWPPPSAPGAPPPPPRKSNRGRWLAVAGAVLAVVLLAVGLTVGLRSNSVSPESESESTPTTTTESAAPIVASQLANLLLAPAEAAEILGAPQLVVSATVSTPTTDPAAEQFFHECGAVFLPGQYSVYAGTGWNSARVQLLKDTEVRTLYMLNQAVVTYRTPADAQQAVDNQKPQWQACQGRTFDSQLAADQPVQHTTFGPLVDENGVLSMVTTKDDINNWRCQRGLSARNNVVIDLQACRVDLVDQGLLALNAIAEKIDAAG
ncbi:serine/threonine-protein kinase PknH/PknJ [Mycolicibacterium brumae]|uniref:non-specific serine/threonine protein kinase n=2 Tax=Mycolicibacterium brumae TaxID=85968 RepID=A0A2G5PF99_9MYCO|nr:sensor domain-containing protein [Mycolicibacterium brumae]PIB76989.1 serine/threonine protein kinase [Mycolicibacterium brumae]